MKLFLMQHGDAVATEIDPDRPLSEQGRSDVQRLGVFLADTPFKPQRIHHSGKTRAKQSAELLAEQTAPEVAIQAVAGMSPKDPIQPWAEQAQDWTEDTLLVGHMPFMGCLTSLLIKGDAEADVVAYRPGSIVCLERLGLDNWQLAWMIRPELLAPAP